MVAVLLEKLRETPEGSPVALADNVSVQLELNVYTTFVMAVLAVTVWDWGPDVRPEIVQIIWFTVELTLSRIYVNGVRDEEQEKQKLPDTSRVWGISVGKIMSLFNLSYLNAVVGAIIISSWFWLNTVVPEASKEGGLNPPVRLNEFVGVSGGKSLTIVGWIVFGGNVIRSKSREGDEFSGEEDEFVLKFTSVNAPKPSITIVVLSSVVSLEKISVFWLFKLRVNKIFRRMSIFIEILPNVSGFDFAVASSRSSNTHSPTRSLAVW